MEQHISHRPPLKGFTVPKLRPAAAAAVISSGRNMQEREAPTGGIVGAAVGCTGAALVKYRPPRSRCQLPRLPTLPLTTNLRDLPAATEWSLAARSDSGYLWFKWVVTLLDAVCCHVLA